MYRLVYAPDAAKDLRKLPKETAVRVHTKLKSILENPYQDAKKLKTNHNVPLYSLKVGRANRCIFTILDGELIVFVIEVGHRSTVYRKY